MTTIDILHIEGLLKCTTFIYFYYYALLPAVYLYGGGYWLLSMNPAGLKNIIEKCKIMLQKPLAIACLSNCLQQNYLAKLKLIELIMLYNKFFENCYSIRCIVLNIVKLSSVITLHC